MTLPLSATLPGTWRLVSRIDLTTSGERRPEPILGEDPVALLTYDFSGHFAAQFMKRDRSDLAADAAVAGANNSRAIAGYDAYFGSYAVDDVAGTVTQTLYAALSPENVGAVLTRTAEVEGDRLVITMNTVHPDGVPVTRTLTWVRLG